MLAGVSSPDDDFKTFLAKLVNIISKRLMEISRRNLLRMAVVRSGILIGYGLLRLNSKIRGF